MTAEMFSVFAETRSLMACKCHAEDVSTALGQQMVPEHTATRYSQTIKQEVVTKQFI